MSRFDQYGWALLVLAGAVLVAAWSFRKVWQAHASQSVRVVVISVSIAIVAVVVLVGLNVIPPPEEWTDVLQAAQRER